MTILSDAERPADTVTEAQPATGGDYAVLRWLVLATFIVILNETVMINAIPRLMGSSTSARVRPVAVHAFMLTMAWSSRHRLVPPAGHPAQAFAIAMTVFCAGTLLATVAPTFPVLLGARVVQAGGTAVMMPLLMTTLMTSSRARPGPVMGNVTLAMSVAPALGRRSRASSCSTCPGAGCSASCCGGDRDHVLGLRRLTDLGEARPGSVDWFSVAAAALGFGTLVYGLSQLGAGAAGNAVPPVLLIVVGLVVVGVFVWRQLSLQRTGTPLLDLRTLTIRTYTVSLLLMAVAFMAMLGSMILLPLYLQEVRHLSALQTGLLVAPGGVAMGLLGPSVGRIFDRFGGRVLVIPGSAASSSRSGC
jgi:DHA2 family lincomycin resistance protein-like MFS transporter